MDLRGKFIVLDGPDGAGKGTQLERLAAWLTASGQTCVQPRDPGGTEIGERIRAVLLAHDLADMDPACETLLFMASRAQLAAEVIRPALAAGNVVLGDRYISATCAYQAAAGYPLTDVLTLGQLAVRDVWPDLTIVLAVPADVCAARMTARQRAAGAAPGAGGPLAGPDAMERRPLDFHARVCRNFVELPAHYPRPVVVIDGNRPAEAVFTDIQEAVQRAFG